jgi:hypothetical protein
MKKLKVTVVLSFAFMILFSSCKTSQNSTATELKFNLQKGKVYDYQMDFDIAQEVSGQKVNTNMSGNYVMEVMEDNNDIKTIKTTYDRMALKVNMPGQNMEIDSDKQDTTSTAINNPSQLMNKMFSSLKGKSFTIKVDKEGKVTEVTGMQQIGEAIMSQLNLPEANRAVVSQTFSAQFNDQNMKDMFSQSFNFFPAKPVKVGDSWEKKISLTNNIPLEMTTTYTVKSIEGNKVTLDSKSKMNISGAANMTGDQTGTMLVDAGTGLVINGEFEQKITGQMSMTSHGKITGKER